MACFLLNSGVNVRAHVYGRFVCCLDDVHHLLMLLSGQRTRVQCAVERDAPQAPGSIFKAWSGHVRLPPTNYF